MKKLFLILATAALLFCSACGASADHTMEGVYSPKPISHGYRFTADGIVYYYETQWESQPLSTGGCDPVYWAGTYTLEDNALTIRISGADHEIWGVTIPDGQVIINGEVCEVLTAGFYTNFSDNPGWSDLDKELGLS